MDVEPDRPGRPAEGHAQPDTLADRLSRLARDLQHQDDVQHTLASVVRAAVDDVPGAQHASISAVRHRREVETVAATGDLPRSVDQAQYETGEGPCLDTLYEHETARLDDVRTEGRWPEFTARLGDLGIGSMLAVQLFVTGDDLGALNLFSEAPDAFSVDSEHVALLFASHAAVAMASAQEVEDLQRGMTTRDLIGQAKGILMERLTLTGDQAFRLLVQASQGRNRKLSDVAGEVVTSAEQLAAESARTSGRAPQ